MILKKKWLVAGLAGLLVITFGVWLHSNRQELQIDAQGLLEETLQNMAAAKSFKYNLESTISVDNRKEVVSRVQGEKDGEGNTHIKGEMVKTPINIYHIDRTTYNWDTSTKKWLVINDVNGSNNMLISELDPLSNFNFKSISNLEKIGFDRIDNRRCIVIRCTPSLENELMEVALKDFQYKLWIDYKDKLLRKATLTATSKNNPKAHLAMKVYFSDFDRDIKINKPKIN